MVGRISEEEKIKTLKTADNKKIAFNHYSNDYPEVIIVAHGFYNNKDTLLFKEISKALSKKYDVITFDFRGHGESTGLFTWTANETQDLRLIIDYAKKHGYKKIGIIGFSLGAAITLIESSQSRDIDSLISVSSPYDFWKIDYHFWEEEMFNDLKLNLGPKGKGKGIKPGNPFLKKIRPINIVHKISPIPILFIHGKDDWLIKPKHSEKLFEKSRQPKEIKIIEKAGHAEMIFDSFPEEFIRICINWFQKTLDGNI